jgi:hypothetical protein
MESHFTPLDLTKYQQLSVSPNKKDIVWTVFLLLGILTLIIVAVFLFILIQKKLNIISLISGNIWI